jgi:hypothetical protein
MTQAITSHQNNSNPWKQGDLVIHADDRKELNNLMVVIGHTRDGLYRTRYAMPHAVPPSWRRKTWKNPGTLLLDPRSFGILP